MKISYLSRIAKLNINSRFNKDSYSLGYGLNGGIVFHNGGVTLAQDLNDSFAILNFAGAKKVKNNRKANNRIRPKRLFNHS